MSAASSPPYRDRVVFLVLEYDFFLIEKAKYFGLFYSGFFFFRNFSNKSLKS